MEVWREITKKAFFEPIRGLLPPLDDWKQPLSVAGSSRPPDLEIGGKNIINFIHSSWTMEYSKYHRSTSLEKSINAQNLTLRFYNSIINDYCYRPIDGQSEQKDDYINSNVQLPNFFKTIILWTPFTSPEDGHPYGPRNKSIQHIFKILGPKNFRRL